MIVATAGHVDHGKTSLIRALTGVDTDRLPEEKKRGMTIDLGFAYLPVDAGGTIGFIDVPGHERFVRNMLCGVTGIDAVLLVVAADDGPMPQTREHLAVLDLLEVSTGAVVITKVDRVDLQRLAEVEAEVHSMIAGTSLADAPVFTAAATRDSGVTELRDWLAGLARGRIRRDAGGIFRLAVDRCFTLAGAGLVVTGTAVAGSVGVGDTAQAVLSGQSVRVRSLHVQNAPASRGSAGERCALNLAGAEAKRGAIERGDWIAGLGAPAPVRKFDIRMRVLGSEGKAFANWTPVHVHLGASDVNARVAVLDGTSIAPGASARAQLVLDRAVGAVHGDRLIIRDQSSRRTIGGGRVIDIFPPVRGRARPERLAFLDAMEEADHRVALSRLLDLSASGLDLERFKANRNLRGDEFAAIQAALPMQVAAGSAGAVGFSPGHWARLQARLLDALADWHRRAPESGGVPEDRILHGTGLKLGREAVGALVSALAAQGSVVRGRAGVRLSAHNPQLGPEDAVLWPRIAPLLEAGTRLPPTLREIGQSAGIEVAEVEALLRRAARHSLVHRISDNRYLGSSVARQYAQIALELVQLDAGGFIGTAAFRDRSGIGRNLTIEVLEFFDRIGFTRRIGDSRRVLRSIDDAFPSAG